MAVFVVEVLRAVVASVEAVKVVVAREAATMAAPEEEGEVVRVQAPVQEVATRGVADWAAAEMAGVVKEWAVWVVAALVVVERVEEGEEAVGRGLVVMAVAEMAVVKAEEAARAGR